MKRDAMARLKLTEISYGLESNLVIFVVAPRDRVPVVELHSLDLRSRRPDMAQPLHPKTVRTAIRRSRSFDFPLCRLFLSTRAENKHFCFLADLFSIAVDYILMVGSHAEGRAHSHLVNFRLESLHLSDNGSSLRVLHPAFDARVHAVVAAELCEPDAWKGREMSEELESIEDTLVP